MKEIRWLKERVEVAEREREAAAQERAELHRLLLAHRDGSKEEFRVQKVLGFQGLKRFELAQAQAESDALSVAAKAPA